MVSEKNRPFLIGIVTLLLENVMFSLNNLICNYIKAELHEKDNLYCNVFDFIFMQ